MNLIGKCESYSSLIICFTDVTIKSFYILQYTSYKYLNIRSINFILREIFSDKTWTKIHVYKLKHYLPFYEIKF